MARDISATDLTRRIALQGPDDELHELADTFDDMLGRLDEAFANQRRFIQEASHELRNPLAVIRTNLEVTLTDPEATTEDLRHTAEVVERSTDRMTRLVDDLLLYARNETPAIEREPVDAATLVHEAADEFRAPAEARGLAIGWDGPTRPRSSAATATPCARRWPTSSPTPPGWPRPAPTCGCGPGAKGRGSGWRSTTRARASPLDDQDAHLPALLAGRRRAGRRGRSAAVWA